MALSSRATLLFLLAACGGGGDDSDASTGATSVTTQPTTAGTTAETSPTSGDATSGDATGPGSSDATGGPTGDPTTTTASSDATGPGSGDATGGPTSDTSGGTSGGDPGLDPDAPPIVDGPWYRPDTKTTFQYQLTGDLVTKYAADAYGIDLFDNDAAAIAGLQAMGRKVICYFSAGSGEDWRPDYAMLDAAALGNPLDGWPGERWLDFRDPSVQQVMLGRLDLAVEKGCDGVDPDNVDVYTQDSGFTISATEQLAYNRWMANRAHQRGLAVGLKNDLEQVPDLVEYYDFEVNEQCHEYDECDLAQPFVDAGKPVFNVEYPGTQADAQALAPSLCPQALAADLRTVMSPYELDGSWRVGCD